VLCALEVVKISILRVCCAKGSVFLEGFNVTSLVVLCVICIWLFSGFWGLDVALGLRVNQYKLFVYLFLPLNSFKFSCYYFTGINNRLFFWCFAELCFVSRLTKFLIWFLVCKNPFKQFTPPPLSFKATYSNNNVLSKYFIPIFAFGQNNTSTSCFF